MAGVLLTNGMNQPPPMSFRVKPPFDAEVAKKFLNGIYCSLPNQLNDSKMYTITIPLEFGVIENKTKQQLQDKKYTRYSFLF